MFYLPALFFLLFTSMNVEESFAGLYKEPTYGSAIVDGDFGEWDLYDDFFADMYRAGDLEKKVESKLYLRYDTSTETLYSLVLAEDEADVLQLLDDAYVKVGGNKLVDGNYSDFEWIEDTTGIHTAWEKSGEEWIENSSGTALLGWEASMSLLPGDYADLNVHTQVYSDREDQTSAVLNRAIGLTLTSGGGGTNPPDPVPEPATMVLLSFGLVALAGIYRKKSKK